MEKAELDPFISELLYDHDCVIIAEFGGFVANYKPAFQHPVQHTISPPAKKIAFNASLKVNDGLLASHIAEIKGIPYQEALKWIGKYVDESVNLLETGKKLHIEKIGSLFYNPERKIQFTPDTHVNYLLDSFGLTTVHSPAIKRDSTIRKTSQGAFKQEKPEDQNFIQKKKSFPWKWIELIPAAAIFIILFLNPSAVQKLTDNIAGIIPGYYIPNPFDIDLFKTDPVTPNSLNADTSGLNAKSLPAENATIENKSVDSVDSSTSLSSEIVSSVEENSEFPEPHKEVPVAIEKPVLVKGTYYIVAGCFKVETNAKALNQELITKGYLSEVIGQYHGLHVVTFQQETNKDDAKMAIDKLRQSGLDAWVLKK